MQPPAALAAAANDVWIIPVSGPIGPASQDFFVRSLAEAQEAGAEAVVMALDTPGGLDGAMRAMIKAILASETPVIAWVTPEGARAASAGTYLLYAAHLAAMSPATNVGSSTPVSLTGPLPSPPGTAPAPEDKEKTRSDSQSIMERKLINDAAAYIRSLAELRERNADWAELSVREGANLSATAALESKVIDVLTGSLPELLNAIDGKQVVMDDGIKRELHTAGAKIVSISPDWRHRFLATITNPNVAYLLIMIGLYGLILEFYAPGLGGPGIVGVVCLLLGAYALQMLPVNYVGLGLMAFGLLLMVAEAMAPSIGVLGLGGVIAFCIGSIILFDAQLPGFRVSLYLISAIAGVSIAFCLVALGAIARARHRPVVSGTEGLLGARAIALDDFDHHGRVHVHGEDWEATVNQDAADGKPVAVKRGDTMKITAINGLVLDVQPTSSHAD